MEKYKFCYEYDGKEIEYTFKGESLSDIMEHLRNFLLSVSFTEDQLTELERMYEERD